jgi:N-acetylmuramoyl-L-alanine amidase
MESTKQAPISKPARRPHRVNAITATLGIAVLLATLFTAWTPNSLLASNLQNQLNLILTPQAEESSPIVTPRPQLRVGIVAGHSGNDSGAVCTDANGQTDLTEADVNMAIAQIVKANLVAAGFQVDLLNEFDTRLNGYRAVALISILNSARRKKMANTRCEPRAAPDRLHGGSISKHHRIDFPCRQHHK